MAPATVVAPATVGGLPTVRSLLQPPDGSPRAKISAAALVRVLPARWAGRWTWCAGNAVKTLTIRSKVHGTCDCRWCAGNAVKTLTIRSKVHGTCDCRPRQRAHLRCEAQPGASDRPLAASVAGRQSAGQDLCRRVGQHTASAVGGPLDRVCGTCSENTDDSL
jgi:hypothetical protein